MGLNTSTYAALGYEALDALAVQTVAEAIRLYNASSDKYGQMSRLSIHDAAYDVLHAEAQTLLAAGREHSALHAEMQEELTARRAAHGGSHARTLMAEWDAAEAGN